MKIFQFLNRTGLIAASVAVISMIAGAGAMAALAGTIPETSHPQLDGSSSSGRIEQDKNLSPEEVGKRRKEFAERQKEFAERQKEFAERQKDFARRQKDFEERHKEFIERQKELEKRRADIEKNKILLYAKRDKRERCRSSKSNKYKSASTSSLGIKHVELHDFKGISVTGAICVVFTQGKSDGYAEVHGDKRALECIRFDYKGGTLNLGYSKSPGSISTRTIVYLTNPELDRIDLSGATSLAVQGMLQSKNLKVQASGASDVNLPDVKGKTLNLSVAGASSINVLSAEMETINAEAVGASTIKLKGVCSRAVNCSALAASEISVTGRCNKKSTSEHSAGRVKDQGLIIENSPVDCASPSPRKKTMPRKP